ncbi:hypothetical protein PIB30_064042 [Stylosanthes scabra]|uniref:Uncharacterized protein n=1 Tax=Stylosanthes scabra TaxID=79078 RepID=A0ABU6WJW8_9FABA|nr:hypothetical protein [Stylosanthes scabra]
MELRADLEEPTAAAFIPPIIHVSPRTACAKLPTTATTVLYSTRHRSLPAAVVVAVQPPSSLSSTPSMCILHFGTHLLMVHQNPNLINPHLPQPRFPPPLSPTTIAGVWRSIT